MANSQNEALNDSDQLASYSMLKLRNHEQRFLITKNLIEIDESNEKKLVSPDHVLLVLGIVFLL